MATLTTPRAIVLDATTRTFQSASVSVDKLTDRISVRLRRPTTANGLVWDASGTMRVTLVYVLDGAEHRCTGQVSGGIRTDALGNEIAEYRLSYKPTVQRITKTTSRRIGETATVTEAYVLLERLRGTIETDLLAAETTASPAPRAI